MQVWCPEEESNLRPTDYESVALPTELSGRRGLPDPDDDVRTRMFGAARQVGEPAQGDLVGPDVGQLAGVDVVEMMVGSRRRIEKYPRRIHHDFAYQALPLEQPERIVNGRTRAVLPDRPEPGEQPVRGQMLRPSEQKTGDVEPLRGRLHAGADQQFCGLIAV